MVQKDKIEDIETQHPKSERDLILEEIRVLEENKKHHIDEIKKLNERKRLKSLEHKALEPYLNENKNVQVGPLLKKLRHLEFKLSQVMNPKNEKEIVKSIQSLEKELKNRFKVERMRKRKDFLESDLKKVDKDIEDVNGKLKDIRDELKERRDSFKSLKKKPAPKKGSSKSLSRKKDEDFISLEDLVEIEKI